MSRQIGDTRQRNGGHHQFMLPLILLSGNQAMKRNSRDRKTRKKRVQKILNDAIKKRKGRSKSGKKSRGRSKSKSKSKSDRA